MILQAGCTIWVMESLRGTGVLGYEWDVLKDHFTYPSDLIIHGFNAFGGFQLSSD